MLIPPSIYDSYLNIYQSQSNLFDAVSNITLAGESVTDVTRLPSLVSGGFHMEVDEGDTVEAVRFKDADKLSRLLQIHKS